MYELHMKKKLDIKIKTMKKINLNRIKFKYNFLNSIKRTKLD